MAGKPNPRRQNGHRRDQVRARVLREENDCALCGLPVDKTLGKMPNVHSARCSDDQCSGCVPDPMSAEVDEIVRVRDGGDPLDRSNCRLTHRRCNRYRDVKTKTSLKPLTTSRSW